MASRNPVSVDYSDSCGYLCKGHDAQGNPCWVRSERKRITFHYIVQNDKGGRSHFYEWDGREKRFEELIYQNGTLSLWETGKRSPHLCETSGEALWKVDELVFGDFKLSNPLKVYFTDIVIDLSEFPYLQELNLSSNAGIIDSLLAKATHLTALNLGWNKVITHQSVFCLSNLTTLDLCSSNIKVPDLDPLSNLQILKFDDCQEMGDLFQLPNIQELHFLANWEDSDDPYAKQQMIHIADALFSLLDKNEEQRNHPKLLTLKNKYEKRILMPNAYDLGATQRKTAYSFNVETASQTAEDLDYVNQLRPIKERLLAKAVENDEPIKYWKNPWERSTEIYQIVLDLLKITGKNLKIFVDQGDTDEDVVSLEEVAQKPQTD